MGAIDSRTTQNRADSLVEAAVYQAFDEWFTVARQGVLGVTDVRADAGPADLPPNMDAWPSTSVWDQIVARVIAPALETVFGMAFDAAARSDVLQQHRYRTSYMTEVFDRLSAVLWPRDAFEQIQGDLAEGLDAGESVAQLRDRVGSALNVDRHSYLAERIARTESHTAVEGGTHSAMVAWQEASGEQMYQRWIATPGGRTRPAHAAASGQTVPINENFTVDGESLAFPGDPSGSAGNTIACRCSTLLGTLDELDELDELPPSAADVRAAAQPTGESMTDTDVYPYADDTEPVSEIAAAPERVYFQGVLAPLDSASGDGRILGTPDNGQVQTTDRMWLSYQERSDGGHSGKVAIGRIDRAWIADGNVWGFGEFDMADSTGTAQEVVRKIRDDYAGTVSVDLTDIDDADVELRLYTVDGDLVDHQTWDPDELYEAINVGLVRERAYFTNWRLGGATLVQDPAFATSRGDRSSARIEIVDAEALVAAVVGEAQLPIADRDTEWDGEEALRALHDAGRLNDGCFWRSDDATPDSDVQADYRLPFATIIDGQLTAVPRGIFAVAGVLQGSMGGIDLPEPVQEMIRGRVGAYYERMAEEFDDDSIVAPWEQNNTEEAAVTASAATESSWAEKVAANVPVQPPAHWFTNPQLTGLTKVRVTEEGRVYGHVADWSQPHIGFSGQPVYAPRCPHGGTYPRFHRQPVRTAEGERVNTGPLTSAGHAPADRPITPAAAMAHYDDPRFVVANVVCGEDEFGIWVAGSLRPGVEPWQVAFADTYSFSGDWRNGEMVAACTVSVEGFFVPSDDTVQALAASAGMPAPDPARVKYRIEGGDTTVLVAAGVVAPDRGKDVTMGKVLSTTTARFDGLAAKIDALPELVGQAAYASAMQALRDKDELDALAREISAPIDSASVAAAAEIVRGKEDV